MAGGRTLRRVLSGTAVVVVMVVLAVSGMALRTPDPVYKGKYLSDYLSEMGPRHLIPGTTIVIGAVPPARLEAAEAVQALGTNAVPLLKAWLNYNPPAWRTKLRTVLLQKTRRFDLFSLLDRRRIAAQVAGFLTTNGAALLPDLERCITNGNPRSGIEPDLLAHSAGGAYIQILEATTMNKEVLVRKLLQVHESSLAAYLSLSAVERADPEWRIRHMITLERGSEAEKVGAALYFAEHPIDAERIIPLLSHCLGSTNRSTQVESLHALASYGILAKGSLPLVSNLLTSPYSKVREAASEVMTALDK